MKFIEMNRKRKIYEISNEDEVNIEKTTKRPPKNYDKRMKVKDVTPKNHPPSSPRIGGWFFGKKLVSYF